MSSPNLIRETAEIITGPGEAPCMSCTYGATKPVIWPDFMLVTHSNYGAEDLGSTK